MGLQAHQETNSIHRNFYRLASEQRVARNRIGRFQSSHIFRIHQGNRGDARIDIVGFQTTRPVDRGIPKLFIGRGLGALRQLLSRREQSLLGLPRLHDKRSGRDQRQLGREATYGISAVFELHLDNEQFDRGCGPQLHTGAVHGRQERSDYLHCQT